MMSEEYKCFHLNNIQDTETHVHLWAGDDVRIHLCRLCATVALGTIVSARIKEAIVDVENEKDTPAEK